MKNLSFLALVLILISSCTKEGSLTNSRSFTSSSNTARSNLLANDASFKNLLYQTQILNNKMLRAINSDPTLNVLAWKKDSLTLPQFKSLLIRTGFTDSLDFFTWQGKINRDILSVRNRFPNLTEQEIEDAERVNEPLPQPFMTPCVYSYQGCQIDGKIEFNKSVLICWTMGMAAVLSPLSAGGILVYLGCGAIALYNAHLYDEKCAAGYKYCRANENQ